MTHELQDAVALAGELRIDPELEAALNIALVTMDDALRVFQERRMSGTKAEYLKASEELTRAIAQYEDVERQVSGR